MAKVNTAGTQQVKVDPFATLEQKIAALRSQRAAKLFVGRMDFVDALLADYDMRGSALKGSLEVHAQMTTRELELSERITHVSSLLELAMTRIEELVNADVTRVRDISRLTMERDAAIQKHEDFLYNNHMDKPVFAVREGHLKINTAIQVAEFEQEKAAYIAGDGMPVDEA